VGYRFVVLARRIAIFVSLVGAACVGSLGFADPPLRRLDVSGAFDAGAPPPGAFVVTRTPADPPAILSRAQWIFDLRWSKGDAYLLGVHSYELAAPQATPRVMGRFAVELYEGPTLVERVRFDFPMLGAPESDDAGLSLEKNLTTRIGVMFPASSRGTRLELWDRATNRRWALPWPPADTRPLDGGAR
jgi:hypothetical protein